MTARIFIRNVPFCVSYLKYTFNQRRIHTTAYVFCLGDIGSVLLRNFGKILHG